MTRSNITGDSNNKAINPSSILGGGFFFLSGKRYGDNNGYDNTQSDYEAVSCKLDRNISDMDFQTPTSCI